MAQAVVFIEANEKCFEPLTLKNKHKCLLPLASLPIIDYTVDCLKKSSFSGVTFICTTHVKDIKAHLGSTWGNQPGFEINVIDGTSSKGSLGDALGRLDKKKFTQPFLVLYGDTVSNVNFSEILRQFHTHQQKTPTCKIFAVLQKLPAGDLQPRRSSAIVWDNLDHMQQMHFSDDGRKFWQDEKQQEFKQRGLLAEAAVFAPSVLDYCDDFRAEATLQKVMWAFQRDPRKIKQPALSIHFLKDDQFVGRVTSIHKYIYVTEHVLSGKAGTYLSEKLTQSDHKLSGAGEYCHSSVKMNQSASIIEAGLVGPDTTVERHSRIVNSVVGKGCKIGKNVWIEGSTIGDGAVIKDNARVVYSILDKKVQVGVDATVMPWSVLGEEVTVDNNLTKTCFTWEWKGRKEEAMETEWEPGPYPVLDWDNQEVDSDDDTELLSFGLEPEIDPETVAEICEMFFDYLMLLYEQCLVDKNMLKRCVKELTEMRRAFRVPVRMMARLVTRGVVTLPVRLNTLIHPNQYMNSENQMMNTFKNILEYMIRTRESMSDCQDGVQDAVNAYPGVIQPHHNEIIDLLRTANIIHERPPPQPQPLSDKEKEKRKKESEHMMRERGPHGGPPYRRGDDDDSMDDDMLAQAAGVHK